MDFHLLHRDNQERHHRVVRMLCKHHNDVNFVLGITFAGGHALKHYSLKFDISFSKILTEMFWLWRMAITTEKALSFK